MTGTELRGLKSWFATLVRRYRDCDLDIRTNIHLKTYHTYQVCREARMVGNGLGLDSGSLNLAVAAALLHDVGRFEQYMRFRTFNDGISVDHAGLGLEMIHHERVLASLPDEAVCVIVDAIRAHNRPEIPHDFSDRRLLFSQILRDADKLDIWRIVLGHYENPDDANNQAVVLGLPELPSVTAAVVHRLRSERRVLRSDLRTVNDLKLFQIGWVYDLNRQPAFRAVGERRYVERIGSTLPPSVEIEDLIGEAVRYVARRSIPGDNVTGASCGR